MQWQHNLARSLGRGARGFGLLVASPWRPTLVLARRLLGEETRLAIFSWHVLRVARILFLFATRPIAEQRNERPLHTPVPSVGVLQFPLCFACHAQAQRMCRWTNRVGFGALLPPVVPYAPPRASGTSDYICMQKDAKHRRESPTQSGIHSLSANPGVTTSYVPGTYSTYQVLNMVSPIFSPYN